MAEPQSDALVLFGITGDLAKKKLLPAVYHLAQRDRPARDRHRRRVARARRGRSSRSGSAKPSPRSSRRSTRTSSRTCCKRLKYVSGDYREAVDVRDAEGCAERRAASAVLPRDPAEPLRRRRAGPARAKGINKGARVVVEKPFGRDLESAEELNAILHSAFPEERDLPHRPLPREGVGREPARVPLRELVARAGLEQPLHQLGADHDGRGVRRRGPRQVLRRGRRAARRRAEPPAAGDGAARDGSAGRRERATASATRRSSCSSRSARSIPPRRCAGSSAATSTRTACDAGSDTETFVALRLWIDSWRWAGVPFLIRTGKALAATALEAVIEFKRAAPAVLQAARHAVARPEPPALPARQERRHHDAPPGQGARRADGDEAGRPAGQLRPGVRRAARGLRAADRRRDRRRSAPGSAARTA